MSEVTPEYILSQCEQASPGPWFPAEEADRTGAPRAAMDRLLNELCHAGLLEQAERDSRRGQGYRLTMVGREVLTDPQARTILRQQSQRMHSPRRDDDGSALNRSEQLRQSLAVLRRPVVVPALIVLNVLNFFLGIALTQRQGIPVNQFIGGAVPGVLIDTGAVSGRLLVQGEWWRLLTCCFVHIGAIHLFVNMLSLWFVGRISEQIWGRGRFLIIYILAGLGGSWAAMMWNPNVTLAGASGAIWGVLGALLAWVGLNRRHLPPSLASTWLRQLGGVLMLNVFISFIPGISASAHFGGGAVGFLVASLLNWQRFGSAAVKYVAAVLLILLPVAQFVALRQAVKADPDWLKPNEDSTLSTESRNANKLSDLLMEKEVDPLLARDPRERDPARVEHARKQLSILKSRFEDLSTVAKQDLEASDALRDYLSSEIKYLELLERRLAAGQFWDEDQQQQLREAKRQRDATAKEWLQLP